MSALPSLSNRYQLLEPLGTGAVADIYRATDLTLNRPVAAKILKHEFTRNPASQRRFREEARALARLAHPNLVALYDFGVDAGQYYMILELVAGSDLKTYLRHQGKLPVETALRIAVRVSEALGLAHRAGLVHCDVKPQNILLTAELEPKLTDFGIVRPLRPGGAPEAEPWGTPQYFSPEQARGEALTPASDVYSLGVVLYEMVTGHLPFHGKDPRGLAVQHIGQVAPAPRSLEPGLPEEVQAVILRMLAKDPRARYRNGDQAARVLRTLLPGLPLAAAPGRVLPSEREAAGTGVDWLAVGLGFLALLAVGGLIPLSAWVYLLYFPPAG